MENKSDPNKGNKTDSINIQINPDFDEKNLSKIFCPLCYQFPEYFIKFISSSNFRLVHECLEKKIIECNIDFEKDSEPFIFNCFYCQKSCNDICIKCKYVMCQKCSKRHKKVPYPVSKKSKRFIESKNNSVINIINSQFICNKHLFEYKFYCPICKINLCQNCKEEHFHINCPYLKNQKFIFKQMNEPSNDCLKKLFKLSKLFYDCYNINASKNQMTLNVLLNTNLADNILSFIQNNSVDKGKEIKNNYLNDIDEKLFLCNEYGSLKFEQNYFDLLIQANTGNINAYNILNGIIEKYERDYKSNIYNKFVLRQTYLSSLNFQGDSLINEINFASDKTNLSETNIILANCLKMINDLKLKNEFLEFCLQLVKMISLKMNYKLDSELRRKIGNIISTIMLKNFNKNLDPIPKSKKLLLYTNEYFKIKVDQNTPTKTNKNIKLKDEGFESLKSKYKLIINMMRDEIKDELINIEKDGSKLFEKEKVKIDSFKNLNEQQEEIDKAIICNLFFTIKWKIGDEFNQQIHNVTHSIDSLLVNEINALENNIQKEISIDDEETQEENSDKSISEIEDDEVENKNKVKIKSIFCPKKFQFLELLNSIRVEKNKVEMFDSILGSDDDDQIINSTFDDFINLLKDIKKIYYISSNISIEDSLNLYLDGKKGAILKTDKFTKKIQNIIKKINKISKNNKHEIEKISKFAEKIKKELETNLTFLSYIMDTILEDLEKLWNRFDIKNLFEKYQIEIPLNPLEEIYILKRMRKDKNGEEIYFLVLALSYFFINPKLKEIQRLKNDFQQIDFNEISKHNIFKREIIKKLKENISYFNEDSLISNVWEKFVENETFVENKKMNELMWNYINNNSQEDFKLDLINLIKPYYKGIYLKS